MMTHFFSSWAVDVHIPFRFSISKQWPRGGWMGELFFEVFHPSFQAAILVVDFGAVFSVIVSLTVGFFDPVDRIS